MKIINIKDDQKAYFLGFDPFELLDKKQSREGFFFGAAEEGEASDTPVGLMICLLDKDVLVIRWLFVDPEYRGKGYGDALLEKAFLVAEKAGCKHVSAYLPKEYGRDFICPFEEEYFKAHAFDQSVQGVRNGGTLMVADILEGEDDLWEVKPYRMFEKLLQQLDEEEREIDRGLMNIIDSTQAEDEENIASQEVLITADEIAKRLISKRRNTGAVGISELTVPKLGRGIRRCEKKHAYKDGEENLYELSPECFDMELSSCVMEEDEVSGLFLIRKDEAGEFWAEYLYDVSNCFEEHLRYMIMRSASCFVDAYPPETKLHVCIRKEKVKALVKRLFPDKV